MLKTLSVVFIILLCAGCDTHVYSHELDGYEEACKDNGGVAKINNFFRDAACMDGKTVRWSGN